MKDVSVNLLPVHRRMARRRVRRVHAWMSVGSVYALLLVVSVIGMRAQAVDGTSMIEAEIRTTSANSEHMAKELTALKKRQDELRDELSASKAVGLQPDWSVPLMFIGEAVRERGVLESIRIEPVFEVSTARRVRKKKGDVEDLPQPVRFIAVVAGVCHDEARVREVIRTLETVGPFSAVKWLETSRDVFLDGSVVYFELECTIDGTER